ncbi:hypothetical protein NDU88_000123 [Pleurodeles waltl]|uniref:RRM domain-containing protein n=1 Tax=Pleurodeles waltl TaxID=8319 RepID=A0AAV7KPG5_PLEWA|nr:hypothetical protein NDU88_000123 [Pleurodeles waltl]
MRSSGRRLDAQRRLLPPERIAEEMGERSRALGRDIPAAAGAAESGPQRGLKEGSALLSPPSRAAGGGWRKACEQRRGDPAEVPLPQGRVTSGHGGAQAGPAAPRTAPGAHPSLQGIEAGQWVLKLDLGGLDEVPQGVSSGAGTLSGAPLGRLCSAPASPCSAASGSDWILCEDENFAAQAPDAPCAQNAPTAVQEPTVKPGKSCGAAEASLGQRKNENCLPQSRKGKSDLAQSAVRSDSKKPSLSKNDSSNATAPKSSSKASKASSLSNNHGSLKANPNHHSSRKSASSLSSQSKKISPVKRTSKSPHSPQSKNHSSLKKIRRSSRPSRSKNRSPAKRLSSSPRSKNHSPLKRTSHSPPSVQSKIHHPRSKINRQQLSNSRSPSPLSKSNRVHSSHSRSRSPLRKINRLPLSRSKSRSPRRRTSSSFPSRSKSRSPLRTRRLHSTNSKSRSPMRYKIRSPLRRTSRLHSSSSKNRSPLREGGRLHSSKSKSRSPSKTSRSNTSVSKSPSPVESSLSSNSSTSSFGVKVNFTSELPDDKTLKEVIFQRFVKYGFVTDVQVHRPHSGRYVLVFYDEQHEQEEALIGAPKTRLFSKTLEVTPWTGGRVKSDSGSITWDDEMTKFSPASTRMLLIENLPKTIAPEKLDNICVQFDDILDIEIKEEPGKPTCSALVEFSSIVSLIKAGKALNRKFFGTSHVNISFAKRSPTNCLWLDGLPPNLSQDYLFLRFSEYGPVAKTLYDCSKDMALITYKHDKDAVTAMKDLKCGLGKLCGHRVMVDFASDRCQLVFSQEMATSCQNTEGFLKD